MVPLSLVGPKVNGMKQTQAQHDASFLAECSFCTGGTTSSKLVDAPVAIWEWTAADWLGWL